MTLTYMIDRFYLDALDGSALSEATATFGYRAGYDDGGEWGSAGWEIFDVTLLDFRFGNCRYSRADALEIAGAEEVDRVEECARIEISDRAREGMFDQLAAE